MGEGEEREKVGGSRGNVELKRCPAGHILMPKRSFPATKNSDSKNTSIFHRHVEWNMCLSGRICVWRKFQGISNFQNIKIFIIV